MCYLNMEPLGLSHPLPAPPPDALIYGVGSKT